MTLLWLNFGLMVNRIVQRVIFVTGYYGLTQGLLSVLRLFWGNLINFMANWRALKQVLQHGNPRRVAWDKTTHDFPQRDWRYPLVAPVRPNSAGKSGHH